MVSYEKQTLNTPNPIARYAHRNRLKRVISLVISQPYIRKVLDYGCGSGAFIEAIQGKNGIKAFGFEPIMKERAGADSLIYSDFSSVNAEGPFDIVTIFETIEHLSDDELAEFLARADEILSNNGRILCSVPIEIGPALLMKEFNRCILHKRRPENSVAELFSASIFGIAAKRANNIKGSHKGFDFRKAIRFLEDDYGPVTIASYGPLPLGTWYGNSQVYFWLKKRTT
jgi:SAM-dependent methyltransferase